MYFRETGTGGEGRGKNMVSKHKKTYPWKREGERAETEKSLERLIGLYHERR